MSRLFLFTVAIVACDSPGQPGTGPSDTSSVSDTAVVSDTGSDTSAGDTAAADTAADTEVAASCEDRIHSPDETDVDCGGACEPCATGQLCRVNGDCLSGVCVNGVCRDESCDDSIQNQDETGVDCGGSCETSCGEGASCRVAGDCNSSRCEDGKCRSCRDGVQTGDETGVDCGGPCGGCGDGALCAGDDDCASGRCEDGRCRSCDDGVRSGDELDVDCGPSCGPCGDGSPCGANRDCLSGSCEGVCRSCSDQIHNGDEGGVDCGGSCAPCGSGEACTDTDDCDDGICFGGVCCTKNACADDCEPTPSERCNGFDDDCDGQTDEAVTDTWTCTSLGVCAGTIARCDSGWKCDYAAHSAAWQGIESRCDGLDNDCDGETDEGCLACADGGAPEVCDGVDNDCDGETDEVAGCADCRASPGILRFAAGASAAFGDRPGPGKLVAGAAGEVFGVHLETAGDEHRMIVSRYSGGVTRAATTVNTSALDPSATLGTSDGATVLAIAARADFSTAMRFHRYDTDGAPGSLGIDTIASDLPASGVRGAFLVDGHAYYAHFAAGATTVYHQPAGGTWSTWDEASHSDVFGYLWIGGRPWEIRNRLNSVAQQDIGDVAIWDEIIDERATSIRLSQRRDGDVAVLEYDGSNSVDHVVRRNARDGRWEDVGATNISGNGRVLGVDVVTDGPMFVIQAANGAIAASVRRRGGTRWETVDYPEVAGLGTVGAAVADAIGRVHVFVESEDGSERIYTMVCPACPGGACVAPVASAVVIGEVLYDTVGADNDTFVELRGPPGTSLDGYTLIGIAGDTGTPYRTVQLSGVIPANGVYLVVNTAANDALKASAQLVAAVDFQNGPDAIALRDPSGQTIDALAYAAAGDEVVGAGEGDPALAPAPGQSLVRNGPDTNDNRADFSAATPSPGV